MESASSSSATSARRTYSTPTRDANDGASNRVYLPSGVREATQPEVLSAVSSSPNLGGRASQVVHPILAGTPVAALHSPAPRGVTLHACDRTEYADGGKPQATIASPGRASLLPGPLCDLPSHGALPLGDLHLSGHRSSSTSPSAYLPSTPDSSSPCVGDETQPGFFYFCKLWDLLIGKVMMAFFGWNFYVATSGLTFLEYKSVLEERAKAINLKA